MWARGTTTMTGLKHAILKIANLFRISTRKKMCLLAITLDEKRIDESSILKIFSYHKNSYWSQYPDYNPVRVFYKKSEDNSVTAYIRNITDPVIMDNYPVLTIAADRNQLSRIAEQSSVRKIFIVPDDDDHVYLNILHRFDELLNDAKQGKEFDAVNLSLQAFTPWEFDPDEPFNVATF